MERFDPAIGGWRLVPSEVDDHPHADHWDWAKCEWTGAVTRETLEKLSAWGRAPVAG